jgi:2-isopropylmalate synthase/UPF0716 protein FxsA
MNLFSALGAILLIIPGILSDIIGVLMQFGVFTNFIVNYLPIRNSANYRFQKDNYKNSKNSKNEEIIDVEIIDDKSSK